MIRILDNPHAACHVCGEKGRRDHVIFPLTFGTDGAVLIDGSGSAFVCIGCLSLALRALRKIHAYGWTL